MEEPKLTFPERPMAGPIVGIPPILLGVVFAAISILTGQSILLVIAIMTAGLGLTAWVGFRDIAKASAAYRKRQAEADIS